MIILIPTIIFSANNMLGKEKYPGIVQELEGSGYPETQSIIMGPLWEWALMEVR